MNSLFSLLLLLALVFLAWAIFAPEKLAKLIDKEGKYNLTKKHLSTYVGLISIGLFILAGITSPPQTSKAAKINLASSSSKQQITTRTVTETRSVPFNSTTLRDNTLPEGTSQVTTQGVNGVETLVYKVTFVNGKQTNKQLVSDNITTQPITEVTTVGTYVAPSCTNGTYVNSSGNTVCRPETSSTVPDGATALCADGTYSFSQSRSGTCSHHGGVAQWLDN